MRVAGFGLVCVLALVAACSPKPAAGPTGVAAPASTCADDGATLPGTGLCVARAVNYLDPEKIDMAWKAPDGCEWTMNDAVFMGDQALLYRAISCKGVTTKLQVAPGAGSAEVTYETSAYVAAGVPSTQPLIRLFTIDETDPKAGLLARVKMAIQDKAEAKTCELREAGIQSWPKDALVVAPTAAARKKLGAPEDGPIAACGPYGVDEDSTRYWQIKQGYAWFFDLGQEMPDFDANSIVLMQKQADGSWAVAP